MAANPLRAFQPPDFGAMASREIEQYAYAYVAGNYHDIFFKKDIDFRDECEYRLVLIDPSPKFKYLDITDSIKGVIVGYNRDELNRRTHIQRYCDELGIWSALASWEGGFPSLEYLMPVEG